MSERRSRGARQPRVLMPEVPPEVRRQGFGEVNCGFTLEMATQEADRCLFCKKPICIQGCPVAIDIPGFIREILEGDLAKAYRVLKDANPLPAICGRVCPQETQCEVKCVVGRKGEPVAIGHLERFVGDWGLAHANSLKNSGTREGGVDGREPRPASSLADEEGMGPSDDRTPTGGVFQQSANRVLSKSRRHVAIVGSGPAGIACAQDLARAGVAVTIFEALHAPGGVLGYGIPPFRLPRDITQAEIDGLRDLGVSIELNVVIGKLFTIEQLMHQKGFNAVFIGTGAGLPKFMGIPGEPLNGVMSANEFLTRANLMGGFLHADTPVGMGSRVAVIGAGNTAIDAVRTALRLGAEEAAIVYRRTEAESPARVEELRHAVEEGIVFYWLTNPVRLIGDLHGRVGSMECVKMELGEPDASGRRSPHPLAGSEFQIPFDTVVYALGTTANPIIARSTPALKTNRSGYIEVDTATQMTSIPGVFAGGDIVTGAATVILALGAGRRAARGILGYLGLGREVKDDGVAMSKVSQAR